MKKPVTTEILLILSLFTTFPMAGTTGKITGIVTDGETGEPLIGCNVIIEGTDLGAASDLDGSYVILNVPPGIYSVTATMIGYEPTTIVQVLISIDKTTRLDFDLRTQVLRGKGVTVVAERKVIRFDVTNSEARVTSTELETMPVSEVADVLKLQAGVTQDAYGGIHIRGGRGSEISYMVDGVSVTDVYDGGISVNIENSNIQELQVISGTFNAEYGRAMSGIINMVTKDGGNDFDVAFRLYTGDHTTEDPIYRYLDSYTFTNDVNFEANLSGPIIRDRITFYASGRYYRSDGWLNGLNTFNMYGDTLFTDLNGNRVRDVGELYHDTGNGIWDEGELYWDENGNGQYDPGEMFEDEDPNGRWDAGEFLFDSNRNGYNGVWDEGEELIDIGPRQDTIYHGNGLYDQGEPFWDKNGDGVRQPIEPFRDSFIDSAYYAVVWSGGNGVWDPPEEFVDSNGNGVYDEGEQFTDSNGNGRWDDAEEFTDRGNGVWDPSEPINNPRVQAMNWVEKWSSQNKITFKLTPKTKLKLKYITSHEESQEYDHNRLLVLDGRNTHHNSGEIVGLSLTQSVSSKSFYEFSVSQFKKSYERYLFALPDDPRYGIPDEWYFAYAGQNPDIPDGTYDEGGKNTAPEIYHDENQNGKYDKGEWYVDHSDYKYGYQVVDSNYAALNYYPQHSYARWGMDTDRFKRETTSRQLRFDLTSQIDKYNQIKLGFEYQQHSLELDSYALLDSSENDRKFTPVVPELGDTVNLSGHPIPQLNNALRYSNNTPSWVTHFHPNRSYYLNEPREFSAYIQDKIEYGDMIVNVGLRYDYFDPNSWVPMNKHEPYIQNPRNPKLDSLSLDERLNIDWGGISHYVMDNSGQDTTWYTYADFGEFPDQGDLRNRVGWYKRTRKKSQLSPRLGIAYPISDNGVVHFSYGLFFQIPQFELLYTNPGYKLPEASGKFGIYGNPDLEPQKTTSYELGLQQKIGREIRMEITGYYRDVRDWVSTGIPIDLGGGASYFTYVNKDYSNVRGVIFTLNKRFSQFHSWHVDYTYQVAEGSNSNPDEEFGAILNNDEPRRSIIPLDWDQSHTINASFFVGYHEWGATVLMQFGSGYPYTPQFSNATLLGQNIANVLITNSRRKQPTLNFDLKLFRNIKTPGNGNGRIFMNIYNLFDRRNEVGIWPDTGRANRTVSESTALSLELAYPESLRPNTIEDYFNHPEWYTPPRQIQLGMEISW